MVICEKLFSVEYHVALKPLHAACEVCCATRSCDADDIDVCWPLGQKFAVSREVMKGAAYAKGFLPAPTFAHADLGQVQFACHKLHLISLFKFSVQTSCDQQPNKYFRSIPIIGCHCTTVHLYCGKV